MAQQGRRPAYVIPIRRLTLGLRRQCKADLPSGGQNIRCHFHLRWPRATGTHLPHGLLNRRRDFGHAIGPTTPLGHRANDILLIIDLVQRTAILAHVVTFYLPS